MAKKIEIFENTLLKLLIRRGLDADRQSVVLTEGELGYTTDTKKLYVGDGQTLGGILVGGSKFLGSVASVTTLFDASIGDLAYSTTTFKLYEFLGGDYTDINNWSVIGGVYYSADDTINIVNNGVSVGTISSANLTSDIVGPNITFSNTNKITLSSEIAVNSIKGLDSSFLSLPGTLNINSVGYNWPQAGITNNSYLKSDISGNLSWVPFINIETTNFVYTSAGIVPVGSIMPFVSSANAPGGWLLCNGQSVAGSAYPELSAVIGTTFGGNSTNFNVPNLINKTLYGVSNSPGSSTLYSVSSGTNSSLSATGALYIIKAKPDGVINVSMSVSSPLCASVNGIQQVGNFNPLSGTVNIGITQTLTAATTFLGGFEADEYGRVTGEVTDPAGTTTTPGPGTRPVYNGSCSPIGFFQTPAEILSNINNVTFTISAYPYLTDYSGARVGSPNFYSIPSNAKNLIVDTVITKQDPNSGNRKRIITAAPNISLLNTGSPQTVGSTEYVIGIAEASGGGDRISNAQQSFIPLSAKSTGDLTAAFRVNDSTSSSESYNIRVIGYTL
jgi:microcystin-dependent protein